MSELFHPEVIAITPLLCAYYCSVRRRWGWFACFAVLAVCWKEDVALAVAVLGLIIALRGDRRVGLITAGAALSWFSLWTSALFPLLNGGKIQTEGLYADVGGSPGGVVRTLFTHPGRITLAAGEPRTRPTTRGSCSRRSGFVSLAGATRRCCSALRRRSSTSSPTCRGRRRSRSTTRRCRSRR